MALVPKRVVLGKPKLNILLYGLQGVGKTTLAASAVEHPDMGPVLVANIEGGLLSLASRGDVDAVDINTITEIEELFWLIRNKDSNFAHYKTLVIDSGSELQTLALEDTVRAELKRDLPKGKNPERTIDDIELQTYGRSGAQLSRLFRWYRDLDIHLIITALPKFTFTKGVDQRAATPILVVPYFTDKLATQVMGFVDMVWYIGDKDGRKYLLTRDTGPYRAKTRGFQFANAIGPVHYDPWLPNLYEILLSSESGTEKAEQVMDGAPMTAEDIFSPEPVYVPVEEDLPIMAEEGELTDG